MKKFMLVSLTILVLLSACNDDGITDEPGNAEFYPMCATNVKVGMWKQGVLDNQVAVRMSDEEYQQYCEGK